MYSSAPIAAQNRRARVFVSECLARTNRQKPKGYANSSDKMLRVAHFGEIAATDTSIVSHSGDQS